MLVFTLVAGAATDSVPFFGWGAAVSALLWAISHWYVGPRVERWAKGAARADLEASVHHVSFMRVILLCQLRSLKHTEEQEMKIAAMTKTADTEV